MSGMSRANQRRNTRHKAKYAAYSGNETRAKNKAYKLIKVIEQNPACRTAIAALEKLPDFCIKSARKRLKEVRGEIK